MRFYLVLRNNLVPTLRCIICTKDKTLRKMIFSILNMYHFWCCPRAVFKDRAPSVILKISFWGKTFQLSYSWETLYVRDSKCCHAVQSEIHSVMIYLYSEVKTSSAEQCTTYIWEGKQSFNFFTQTADNLALHCSNISGYENLHQW